MPPIAYETSSESRLNLARFQANANLKLQDRVEQFSNILQRELERDLIVAREVVGPMDREVRVRDPETNEIRPMLMFGSNNYLGLANHPYILQQVRENLNRWGAGLGGPPLLNGMTHLHVLLEERVSALKQKDAALLYSSGYSANIGWLTALPNRKDIIILDELCHASIYDGARASKAAVTTFKHNCVDQLREKLAQADAKASQNIFVVVEGVYSMDGDLAPLDIMVPLCKEFGAFIALDDAHGTGVLGSRGCGAAEFFAVEHEIDLVMGTFSKALAASGAFVAANRQIVDYLRFFSRSYFFSASMPPALVALIHAGLDLLESELDRRQRLHANVRYLVERLESIGIRTSSQSAIVPVRVPRRIRRVSRRMHEADIFLNAIEYPAVPQDDERFRISVISEHTADDIDRLVEALDLALEEEGIDRSQRSPRQCR